MSFLSETGRLLLRPLTPGDRTAFRPYSLSECAHLSIGTDTAAWRGFAHLLGHLALRDFAPLAIVLREAPLRAVGMAGPHYPIGWPEPEIGSQLWDGAREGKRLASEAVVASRQWCAVTYGWTHMVSYIKPEITRSEELAHRLRCALDETATRRPDGAPVWRHPV